LRRLEARWKDLKMRVIIALLIGAASCFAQSTPHITAVVSGADFNTGVALEGIGTVFGTNLSDGLYQFSALPFPKKLGQTDAFVCLPGKITQFNESLCAAVQLIFVSPSQINFLMFDALPNIPGFGGGLSLVVRVNGVIDDGASSGTSQGTQIGATKYGANPGLSFPQPRIFTEGYDCFIDPRFQDANKNCGL